MNLQRVTTDFLQQATSATSKEPILQQVTSDFATSNEQRVNLQQVNDRISQRVTSDFTTGNE